MDSISPANDARHVEPNPLAITYRPVDELIAYARNARTHTPEQIEQIAASIKEFGWTNPVLIGTDGGIVAGHGRVLAARKLKISRVPCVALAHLTDAQRRAYVIADNKLAENAGWDSNLLALELGELRAEGFNLDFTGFSEVEQLFIFGEGGNDPNIHWQGLPDFVNEKSSYRRIIVHFTCQEDVDAFAKLIGQEIGPKTVYIGFPTFERMKSESVYVEVADAPDATAP